MYRARSGYHRHAIHLVSTSNSFCQQLFTITALFFSLVKRMEHSSPDCVYKDTSNNALPITERANSLTDDIDVATPSEIIRLLRQCDSQLFSGWSKWPGLYDHETLETMKTISEEILSVLHSPENSMIVLSGCGTSGRLGFLVSQSFNEISRQQGLPPLYQYQIAGGDAALFVSVEAPEDDWLKGKEDLQKLTKEKYKVSNIK